MEDQDKDEGPGVPDMTMMPLITEDAINENLKRRYKHDLIYVSFEIITNLESVETLIKTILSKRYTVYV